MGGPSSISAYTITESGALTEIDGSPFLAGSTSLGPAIDPTGRFLYVVNLDTNDVSEFLIDAMTGALTPAGSFGAGVSPTWVTVDPTGNFAYVSNCGDVPQACAVGASGSVSAYTIDSATEALIPVDTYAAGTSSDNVTVHWTGQFVYVTNAPLDSSPFPAGTAPVKVVTTAGPQAPAP